MRVNHELEPIYDEGSRILILGSFPSVKSRENKFYYGHPQNRFWRIMEHVFDVKLKSVEEKKAFLYQNHIALWDVIGSCEIVGSSDASIKNIQVNDLAKILEKSKIEKIIVNGKKAQQLYQKYLEEQTKIKCIVMPSTSPANAAYSLDRLIEEWQPVLTD